MEVNTATLRSSAPQWSLAGDKQLLDILNNIHQSLVSRCQEVNRQLDEMVSALDGASVNLQNVNNKFMALSNSQFIESRVYDDDVDVAALEPPKETPKPVSPASDITKLKYSVASLVAAHETIEILASDSDDDEDDEARVVLKPKDMYTHRPLPYIIGSHSWRSKWHAGLHPEDSDSDSSMSKQDGDNEEYSDSEPEGARAPAARLRENSSASSELPSEQDIGSVPTSSVKPSPSDIAAELARRLGGQHVQIPVQEPVYSEPNPVPRKVYRPEQPTTATIFSDEPPPLDDYQSEGSDSPEDDIFAELHKNKPYAHSNKEQSRLAEDLFAGLREYEEGDVFSDFRDTQSSTPAAKQKSALFEDESEPELFAEKQSRPPQIQEDTKPHVDNVKKPIGGISVFGNTQGAESIGAAILRRNRRKSSSDDEIAEETPKKEPQVKSQEKDIFDDLFAKSEKENKRTKKTVEKPVKEEEKPKPKVDLFSDNIFDDIDDIFTTNFTKSVNKDASNQKSLFEDDDDIFSDIAVTKASNKATVDSKSFVDKNKSIFDSDDDLFSDNTVKQPPKLEETSKESKSYVLENEIDDIFTKSDIKNDNIIVNTDISHEITNNTVLNNRNNSRKHNNNSNNLINSSAENKEALNKINKNVAKSIFDDDDDDNDDLFGNTATTSSTSALTSSQTQSHKSKDQKASLFDDNSDDNDLFGTQLTKHDNHDKKSINNKDITQNDEIKTDACKKPTKFHDSNAEDIFVDTNKQLNVENKVLSNNQTETLIKETEIPREQEPINNKKQSVFDDEEESLFGERNKKLVQNKPELLKKPTIIPRNNKNGSKKQECNIKDIKHDNNNQEIFPRVVKQESNDKSFDSSGKESISSPNLEKTQLPNTKQNKMKISEEKINFKLPLTEENTAPIIEEKKPELTEEKIEPKLPVVEENTVDNTAHHSKLDSKYSEIESALPDTNLEVPPPFEVENNNDDDIFANEPNDSSSKNVTAFHTSNVFDDIFTEPPAFEKSKEPKKSKNINALFDDDSDDEALFFKKNEPVVDEKPDLSPDVNRDGLFGIFHDEPPAIEFDFTQKPTKSNVNDDYLKSDSDDDLFSAQKTIQTEKDTDGSFESVSKLSEFDSNSFESTSTHNEESITKVDKLISDQKPQIDKPKPPIKESQKDATDGEPKKVGKLKTMNFNIDVSTLLPGASPKKKVLEQLDTKNSEEFHKKDNNKSLEQTDGQMFAKSSEDLHAKEKIEHMMVKSVSFEGECDSQVLDNKISKERAKIQVKRRPSTRRARKEAVKKSAIDFGDDSTDNSSSFDDPPKRETNVEHILTSIDNNIEPEKTISRDLDFEVKVPKTEDLFDFKQEIEANIPKSDEIKTKLDTNPPKERLSSKETKSNIDLERNSDQIDSVTKVEEEPAILAPLSDNDSSENTIDTHKNDSTIDLEPETKDIAPKYTAQTKSELNLDSPKTVTSKIVYILNDEDIFSSPVEKTEVKPKSFDIDDEDLFGEGNSKKTTEVVPNISTIGNLYKDSTKTDNKNDRTENEMNKKALFDDLSDEDNELFNTNIKTSAKPKGILDSDSEEDLFGRKKTKDKPTVVKEIKKVEVKSSLFGDEDDDDDLFGAKVKSNTATSPQPARSNRDVVSKPAEPVFDDPLSMLGANDD